MSVFLKSKKKVFILSLLFAGLFSNSKIFSGGSQSHPSSTNESKKGDNTWLVQGNGNVQQNPAPTAHGYTPPGGWNVSRDGFSMPSDDDNGEIVDSPSSFCPGNSFLGDLRQALLDLNVGKKEEPLPKPDSSEHESIASDDEIQEFDPTLPTFNEVQDTLKKSLYHLNKFHDEVEHSLEEAILNNKTKFIFVDFFRSLLCEIYNYSEYMSKCSFYCFEKAAHLNADEIPLKTSLTNLGNNFLKIGEATVGPTGNFEEIPLFKIMIERREELSKQWYEAVRDPFIPLKQLYDSISSVCELALNGVELFLEAEGIAELREAGLYDEANNLERDLSDQIETIFFVVDSLKDNIVNATAEDWFKFLYEIDTFYYSPVGALSCAIGGTIKILKNLSLEYKAASKASDFKQYTSTLVGRKGPKSRIKKLGTPGGNITTNTNPAGQFATGKTGTVWDSIKVTDRMYEGTRIPRSFELSVGSKKFWVHPNATEHMFEYITRNPMSHGMPINSQVLLYSFKESLEIIVNRGINYEDLFTFGNWQFKFNKKPTDIFPVVRHALYKPKGF